MSTQTMTPVGTANIPVRRMDFEFEQPYVDHVVNRFVVRISRR